MWICLNNSFVSIVQHPLLNDVLIVRGRRHEDVMNFVNGFFCRGYEQTDTRDYRYRVLIDRNELPKILATHAEKIDYTNFKNSVEDDNLHDMYSEVWASGVRNLDPEWVERHY